MKAPNVKNNHTVIQLHYTLAALYILPIESPLTVPPGNYVLAAAAIWTASVASAEGLRVYMYGFKIFCSSTASEVFEALHSTWTASRV